MKNPLLRLKSPIKIAKGEHMAQACAPGYVNYQDPELTCPSEEMFFCAGRNVVPIKCFGTPFSAGVFSRKAFAEESCFR